MLRQAMAEIRDVMKKYDCAGYVALGSISHFEFQVHIDATWNLMTVEQRPDGSHGLRLRLKGKLDSARQRMANATVGFLYNLRDNLGIQYLAISQFSDALEKQSQVDHNPPPFTNDDREIEHQ
jgi:hypothetical protein